MNFPPRGGLHKKWIDAAAVIADNNPAPAGRQRLEEQAARYAVDLTAWRSGDPDGATGEDRLDSFQSIEPNSDDFEQQIGAMFDRARRARREKRSK